MEILGSIAAACCWAQVLIWAVKGPNRFNAAHDTQNVVIYGKATKCRKRRRVSDRGGLGSSDVGNVGRHGGVAGLRRGLERQGEHRRIDARHVERARGRVLARRQRERHEVDAGIGVRLVGLVRHDLVVDRAHTNVSAIVAVEHELGVEEGRERLGRRARVAAGELAVGGRVGNDPREHLRGVVERKADLLRLARGANRDVLVARELDLLDEVLVRLRRELLALVLVEVDVIGPESRVEGGRRDAGDVRVIVKLKGDAELVVLHILGLKPQGPILSHGIRLYLRASRNSAKILCPTVVKSLNVLHSLA